MFTNQDSALSKALGLLKNLAKNLKGDDGYIWLKAFKQFMRKEVPTWGLTAEQKAKWFWKKITIKPYVSSDEIIEMLNEQKIVTHGTAIGMLTSLRLKDFKPHEATFGMFTFQDLGFYEKERFTYEQIMKKALKMGLKKCSVYDGPILRLEYLDQPCKEYSGEIIVASDPINENLFNLANIQKNLCLSVVTLRPTIGTRKFSKETKFIFRFD